MKYIYSLLLVSLISINRVVDAKEQSCSEFEISLLNRDYALLVLIENNLFNNIEIYSNLEAGGLLSTSNGQFRVKSTSGKEFFPVVLLDSAISRGKVNLPRGFIFGRKFKLGTIKTFFNLSEGEYLISYEYDVNRFKKKDKKNAPPCIIVSDWLKVEIKDKK